MSSGRDGGPKVLYLLEFPWNLNIAGPPAILTLGKLRWEDHVIETIL